MKKILLTAFVFLNSGCFGTGLIPKESILPPTDLGILPSMSLSSASLAAVNQLSSVGYQIIYTDAANVTLSAADIILNTTGTATCSKSVSNVTSSSATVTLSSCSGNGSVSFHIAASSASNLLGGMASASPNSASFTVDNSGVSTGIFNMVTGNYSSIPPYIVITFPEIMDGSSISAADFTLGGSCSGVSISSVATSGAASTINLAGVGSCVSGETVILTTDMSAMSDALGNMGSGLNTETYLMDTVGPTSGVFAPALAAVNSTFNSFGLIFPDAVDAATVSASDFSISGTCSGVSVSSASASGASATVNLSGVSSCTNGQTIIVTANLATINDLLANAGVGITSTTYTFDNLGPNASFGLAAGPIGAIPPSIAVTLSSDTNMSSVTSSDFSLSGSCSGASISGITKAANVATVLIAGGGSCLDTQTVNLSVNLTGINDTAGNSGSGSSSILATLDLQGPAALLSLVSGGVILIPSSLTATFDADADMNSVTAANFAVSGTCGASVGSVTKLANVATINLSGTGSCTDSQTVIISANFSGVSDLLGNMGSGSVSNTLTLDSLGPAGSFAVPSATLNLLPTSVALTLSADTDMSSLAVADISVSGSCGATLGSLVKVGVVATLNLSGTAGCTNNQTVVISVNQAGVSDLLGNTGSGSVGITLTFDNVGPTLTLVAPTGRYNPLYTTMTATFSADTDMSSVSAADFIVSGTCLGASLFSVGISGQVATLNLNGTGSCLTEQTIIATANPLGVSDMTGNFGLNIPTIVTHTFDNVAPTALMLPLGIPMLVLPTSVAVTFDLDADMSTVTLADFSVGGSCGASISSVTKIANVATVNLSGTGSCVLGSFVDVTTTLTAVQDQAGNFGVGTQVQTYTQL